jgi:hypothetical protein
MSKNGPPTACLPYVVDGIRMNLGRIQRELRGRGCNKTNAHVRKLLLSGANTISDLSKPVDAEVSSARKAYSVGSRQQCAEAMAAVDARRKELKP